MTHKLLPAKEPPLPSIVTPVEQICPAFVFNKQPLLGQNKHIALQRHSVTIILQHSAACVHSRSTSMCLQLAKFVQLIVFYPSRLTSFSLMHILIHPLHRINASYQMQVISRLRLGFISLPRVDHQALLKCQ